MEHDAESFGRIPVGTESRNRHDLDSFDHVYLLGFDELATGRAGGQGSIRHPRRKPIGQVVGPHRLAHVGQDLARTLVVLSIGQVFLSNVGHILGMDDLALAVILLAQVRGGVGGTVRRATLPSCDPRRQPDRSS